MIWLWIYEPALGLLNVVIGHAGIPRQKWLYDVRLALPSVVVMSVWKEVGYNMIVYLAGLQSIPGYLYEAATIDGAGEARRFVHVTWPMLRPITFFLLVTGLIANFNVFEQVQVLTGGGPMNSTTTVVHQIYDRAFSDFQMGYASAMAVTMLVVVALVTLANFRLGDRRVDTIAG
jgi:ABC-type sugar transport system permease subunit